MSEVYPPPQPYELFRVLSFKYNARHTQPLLLAAIGALLPGSLAVSAGTAS